MYLMLKKGKFSLEQSYYKYTHAKMVLATLKVPLYRALFPFSIIIKIFCYNKSR